MKSKTKTILSRVVIYALVGMGFALVLVSVALGQIPGVSEMTEGRTAEYLTGAIAGLVMGAGAGFKVGADRYKEDAERYRRLSDDALRARFKGDLP